MAVDDVDWRLLFDQLLIEQSPTPCGHWVALLQFAHIYTRFEKEQHPDA